MKTIDQIDQIAANLNFKVSTNKKSYAALVNFIADDENILGFLDGNSRLAVITSKRFMVIETSLLSPTDCKDTLLENISDVLVDAGFLSTDIKVVSKGGSATTINLTDKKKANDFKQVLMTAVSNRNSGSSNSAPVRDKMERLKDLVSLKEMGALTEEEFQSEKKKILSES